LKPTRGPEKGEGLALFHSSGTFKGNCRKCGEYGHKAAYCKKKDKTEEKSTSISKENSEKGVKCSYCHQKGYTLDVCRIKQRVEAKKKGNEATLEVLMAAEQSDNKGHLWIGDSGASSHMTNSDEGLYDIEESDQVIIIGNREKLKAIKTGKLKRKTKDLNGNDINKFHLKLGHPSKEITIATAKHLGVKLDGSWEECEECMLGKARKRI
jgi:hypothetical protein